MNMHERCKIYIDSDFMSYVTVILHNHNNHSNEAYSKKN
jgi:hypothetical protein